MKVGGKAGHKIAQPLLVSSPTTTGMLAGGADTRPAAQNLSPDSNLSLFLPCWLFHVDI